MSWHCDMSWHYKTLWHVCMLGFYRRYWRYCDVCVTCVYRFSSLRDAAAPVCVWERERDKVSVLREGRRPCDSITCHLSCITCLVVSPVLYHYHTWYMIDEIQSRYAYNDASVFCLLSAVFCLLSCIFCLLSSVFCLVSFHPTWCSTSRRGDFWTNNLCVRDMSHVLDESCHQNMTHVSPLTCKQTVLRDSRYCLHLLLHLLLYLYLTSSMGRSSRSRGSTVMPFLLLCVCVCVCVCVRVCVRMHLCMHIYIHINSDYYLITIWYIM
jgi:hypothetical protein